MGCVYITKYPQGKSSLPFQLQWHTELDLIKIKIGKHQGKIKFTDVVIVCETSLLTITRYLVRTHIYEHTHTHTCNVSLIIFNYAWLSPPGRPELNELLTIIFWRCYHQVDWSWMQQRMFTVNRDHIEQCSSWKY